MKALSGGIFGKGFTRQLHSRGAIRGDDDTIAGKDYKSFTAMLRLHY
jgi:hypothetical protein